MGWSDTRGCARALVAPDLRPFARAVFLAAAAIAVLASPARAQLCSSNGGGNLDCDMTYYNAKIKCQNPKNKEGDETVGTQPPCPKDPMPMKDTELKSFIKDMSPYLFSYARDKDYPNKAYTGTYYRGTPGDSVLTFQMVNGDDEQEQQGNQQNTNQPGKYKTYAQCVNQINLQGGDTVEEQAKIVRLQLDNCVNQYVLNSALYQGSEDKKQSTTAQSLEDVTKPEKRISLSTHCQPLKTKPDAEQEYSAIEYLRLAWEKVLQHPSQHDSKRPTEPYIEGLTLQNPIEWPSNAPNVTLKQISDVPYEEINDPSHPYTPRWDFEFNERDEYSPKTDEYSSDTENSVFCAGIHKGDEKQMMKVDVLKFRRPPFDKWVKDERIKFNEACFKNEDAQQDPCCLPTEFDCIPQPCWVCYGLSGKTDSESTFPPCATQYNGSDLEILRIYELTDKQTQYPAPCTRDNSYHTSENNIDKLCKDLRKPLTPINKLKMRIHNTEKPDEEDVLYEGVSEGLTFKEYFGDHMPYMRLWDAGQSIQRITTTDATFQDPMDNLGQWTAIVGVGREGMPKGQQNSGSSGSSSSSSGGGDQEEEHKDERCLYGGWGDDVSFAGVTIKKPNGITSWTELKLAQARALRDQHLSCLPRYEKAYKPGASEALALLVTGSNWNSTYVSCTRDPSHPPEYHTAADNANSQPCSQVNGQRRSSTGYNIKQEGWPNAWRGYISAKDASKRFPKLGGGGGSNVSGLDNAECGDIVLMEKGSVQGNKPGLGKVGVVVGLNLPNKSSCNAQTPSNCATTKNCYVDVVEYDNGKWPDACGTTDSVNEKKTRRMWKPGMLPSNVKTELEGLHWTTSCEDTKISSCEMKIWDSVKLYRIRDDVRDGAQQESNQ